jgi:trigger factor
VDGQPFSYTARVEVLPVIESVKYEGLAAKRTGVKVTDEQVSAELDQLRDGHATLEEPSEARPAAKGDQVSIDFEVDVEAQKVPDAGANDFQVTLGRGTLFPTIEEGLVGMNVGDKKDIEVTMPAAHQHKKLRGKTAIFHVTLKGLKERVLPNADDEFAKDLGQFETLEALKAEIRERLTKQGNEAVENAVAEQLVVELVKANPIDVPPSLVQRQMRVTEQEILNRARSQGGEVTGLGEELRGKVLADSELKVRAGLLMAEIAKKEAIQIGNDEIEQGLKELAEQTGKNVAKLRVEYREQSKREMLVGMILENKVLDIIQSKAKIEEG